MLSYPHITLKRSISIPIKKSLSTPMKEVISVDEYSLKQNIFDPSKSSPPNEFMNKLRMRMSMYNTNHGVDMKDGSRDNE